jgi:hypothetical protein
MRFGTRNASDGEHDICFCVIVLVDKIQRANVQSCGATVISKYAAMMSWVS